MVVPPRYPVPFSLDESREYADHAQAAADIEKDSGVSWSLAFGALAGFIIGVDFLDDGKLIMTHRVCNQTEPLGRTIIEYQPAYWPYAFPAATQGRWLSIIVLAALNHRCPGSEEAGDAPEAHSGS
jgi:hypothetical protein